MPDHIDHPVHYTQGIECIDYILSHNMDYLEGNIVKYVTRYKFKHGVDDLRKAEWYLKRLLKREALGPAVMPVGPDWSKPHADAQVEYPEEGAYWPPKVECAKPIFMEPNPKENFCCSEIDLGKEYKDEVLKETLQAMKDEECRSRCANYIPPYKF
jgi:hypothetical protein